MTAAPTAGVKEREGEAATAAEDIMDAVLVVLLGDKRKRTLDNGLMPLLVHGRQRTARCPHGQWLTQGGPRPHGDGCSDRCDETWAVIGAIGGWLQRYGRRQPPEMPAQPPLWAETEAAG